MSEFVKVASTGEIKSGACVGLKVDGVFIGIYNVNGAYYAINNICPHLGGMLSYGFFDEKIVTCPLHMWEYDVTTGECVWPGEECVASYPVKVEGDDIFVDVNAPKFVGREGG